MFHSHLFVSAIKFPVPSHQSILVRLKSHRIRIKFITLSYIPLTNLSSVVESQRNKPKVIWVKMLSNWPNWYRGFCVCHFKSIFSVPNMKCSWNQLKMHEHCWNAMIQWSHFPATGHKCEIEADWNPWILWNSKFSSRAQNQVWPSWTGNPKKVYMFGEPFWK